MVDHTIIKIFASQMSVSSSGFDFKDSIFDCQNTDVEGSAAQIENEDVAFSRWSFFLVETIGNGSSGGFVDDSQNVQTSNDTWNNLKKIREIDGINSKKEFLVKIFRRSSANMFREQ